MENKNQTIKEKCFYPMLVSNSSGRVDDSEAIIKRWDFFNTLPQPEKDKLLSIKVPFVLKSISEKLSLSQGQSEELSRIVRQIFFKQVKKEELARALAERVENISENVAPDVAKIIVAKILEAEPVRSQDVEVEEVEEVKEERNIQKISFKEALSKYSRLGEQLISSAPLELRYFNSPVRPSIKNWITDYQNSTKDGEKGSVARGNFIFNSPNAKKLTKGEKYKVGFVLKSFDENSEVGIDTDNQKLVFEQAGEKSLPKKDFSAQQDQVQPQPRRDVRSQPQSRSNAKTQSQPRRDARSQSQPRQEGKVFRVKTDLDKRIEKKAEAEKDVSTPPPLRKDSVSHDQINPQERDLEGFRKKIQKMEAEGVSITEPYIKSGVGSKHNLIQAEDLHRPESGKKAPSISSHDSKNLQLKREGSQPDQKIDTHSYVEQLKKQASQREAQSPNVKFSSSHTLPSEKQSQKEDDKKDVLMKNREQKNQEQEKARQLNDMVSSSKSGGKSIYRITPMGFVDREEKNAGKNEQAKQ